MAQLNVRFPDKEELLDQDEEYFILNGDEHIKFHDYVRIYRTPNLYETVFHERLKCQSPNVMKQLFYDHLEESDFSTERLRILDFGAGNGLVGDALSTGHPELIVGIDILDAAKEAALRDRQNVYKDYLVADMGNPDEKTLNHLQSFEFNAMVSVAAFGFGHIAPSSFINSFNLVQPEGWVVFNLRDRFLSNEDKSGFKKILDWINGDFMNLVEEKTYVHRLNTIGEPIHYTAIVARKIKDIDPSKDHIITR